MKRKIIYVDDDPINLALFEAQFEEYFQIKTCEDPTQVRSILQGSPINLMVTDYQMPGLNGMQLIQQVKADHSNLICIMLTGFVHIKNELDHTLLFDFVPKPFDVDKMRECIERGFDLYDSYELRNVS